MARLAQMVPAHVRLEPSVGTLARYSDPRHHLPQRLSVIPGAAHDGPLRPALVRRRAGDLDHLPAVLPDHAVSRIRLCALARITPHHALANWRARNAVGGLAPISAHRAPRGPLETGIGQRSFRPNSAPAR